VLLYLLGSIVLGLIVGILAALLRDVTDTKIQDLREISRELGPMPLCMLPYQKEQAALTSGAAGRQKSPLPALDSRVPLVESLRSLRTSLMLSRSGAPPRSVLVTSPLAGEGKSFLSWNLAILFRPAGQSESCCAMQTFRHPWLHRNLEVSPEVGLSTMLAGLSPDHGATVVISRAGGPGLFLIPAGPLPPTPQSCWRPIKWQIW